MQSLDRKLPIQSLGEDGTGRLYVNCLTDESATYIALLIMAVNRKTDEEKLIDALLPDDRLGTVLAVIHQVLGGNWTLLECWEIEPLAPIVSAA